MSQKVMAKKLEEQALSLLTTSESAGKTVRRVVINGRRIEIELSRADDGDDFDWIDMRHGKA